MTSDKLYKSFSTSIFCLWLVLAGCATTGSDNGGDSKMSKEMGGGGRMSEGGMGRGGGHQGPPSKLKDLGIDTEQELPAEAFSACEGKEAGTEVQYIPHDGEVVDATCTVVDDHFVAMPIKDSMRN